jgi:hypothetical protein
MIFYRLIAELWVESLYIRLIERETLCRYFARNIVSLFRAKLYVA